MALSKKLALVTLKYLIKQDEVLTKPTLYFSLNDRENIRRECGERLPQHFPSPERGMNIGEILQAAVYGDTIDSYYLDNGVESNFPYWDDNELVFLKKVFRSATVDRKISSTWGDLGEWLKKNMNTATNLLTKWLESDLSFDEFREKYSHITKAAGLGLL
jgi:hypothetical protein